jgi:thiamine kinase-like enzyme
VCNEELKIKTAKSEQENCIKIKQLTEGLTNQLFKVVNKSKNLESGHKTVLFRIYGTDTKEFFDPAVEVSIFKMLSEYRI